MFLQPGYPCSFPPRRGPNAVEQVDCALQYAARLTGVGPAFRCWVWLWSWACNLASASAPDAILRPEWLETPPPGKLQPDDKRGSLSLGYLSEWASTLMNPSQRCVAYSSAQVQCRERRDLYRVGIVY